MGLGNTKTIGRISIRKKYKIPSGFRLFKIVNPTPSSANGRVIGTEKTGFNSQEFNTRTSILLVNPCSASAGDITFFVRGGNWEYASTSWSSSATDFRNKYQLSGTTYINYPDETQETDAMAEGCANEYDLKWKGTGGYYRNSAFSVGNGITIANSPRLYTTGSPTVKTTCSKSKDDIEVMVMVKADLIKTVKSGVEEIFY